MSLINGYVSLRDQTEGQLPASTSALMTAKRFGWVTTVMLKKMTAAEAVAEFQAAKDQQGREVIIPRRINPTELHQIRILPQVLGWRYYPGANGRLPCRCDICTRGNYGGRRLRERLKVPPEKRTLNRAPSK